MRVIACRRSRRLQHARQVPSGTSAMARRMARPRVPAARRTGPAGPAGRYPRGTPSRPRADLVGDDLRLQVAQHLARHADIGQQDRSSICSFHSPSRYRRGRDADAFLEQFAAIGDQSEPPTSGECAIEPAKPTSAPRWKIGADRGEVRQVAGGEPGIVGDDARRPGARSRPGSAPGRSSSSCGRMQEKEAMPPVFSLTLSPLRSISTVAKSLDSRTMVEKAVRSRPVAASSAMEISRDQ
jgi:hypothetical protein